MEKEVGDPNGIRTRVTAVKGRCPKPLDDRVVSARAAQYRREFWDVTQKFNSSKRRCRGEAELAEFLRKMVGLSVNRQKREYVRLLAPGTV